MSSSLSTQRWLVLLAVTLCATIGAPIAVIAVLLGVHAASFHGTCGPYPTDIPAYACGFDDYMVGFFEPFAAIGLIVISIVTATLAFGASGLSGLVWILASARRAR